MLSRKRKAPPRTAQSKYGIFHNQIKNVRKQVGPKARSKELAINRHADNFTEVDLETACVLKLTRAKAKKLSIIVPPVHAPSNIHQTQCNVQVHIEKLSEDYLSSENISWVIPKGSGEDNSLAVKYVDNANYKTYKKSCTKSHRVTTGDGTVALRTRSNLCLSSTPLKTIIEETSTSSPASSAAFIAEEKIHNSQKVKELIGLKLDEDEEMPVSEVYKIEPQELDYDTKINKIESDAIFEDHEIEHKEVEDSEEFEKESVDLDYENHIVKKEVEENEDVDVFKNEMIDIDYGNVIDKIKHEECKSDEQVFEKELDLNNDYDVDGIKVQENEFAKVFVKEMRDENLEEYGGSDALVIKKDVKQEKKDESFRSNTMDNFIEPIWIGDEHVLVLQQQMTQHVQMLTQNFILTYKHPELHNISILMKEYLFNMKFLCDGKKKSSFCTVNLSASLELVEKWEQLLATNSDEVKKMFLHIEKTITRSIQCHRSGTTYIVTFPSLIMETISNSTAIVYPSLLPKIPFKTPKIAVKNCTYYTESEDHLISLGLEQFMPLVTTSRREDRKKVWSKKKGVAICHQIQTHMMAYRECIKIFNHINFVRRNRSVKNPVNYYFQFGAAPPYVHHVIPLGQLLPCSRRSPEDLPYQWKEFVKSQQVNQKMDSSIYYIILAVP